MARIGCLGTCSSAWYDERTSGPASTCGVAQTEAEASRLSLGELLRRVVPPRPAGARGRRAQVLPHRHARPCPRRGSPAPSPRTSLPLLAQPHHDPALRRAGPASLSTAAATPASARSAPRAAPADTAAARSRRCGSASSGRAAVHGPASAAATTLEVRVSGPRPRSPGLRARGSPRMQSPRRPRPRRPCRLVAVDRGDDGVPQAACARRPRPRGPRLGRDPGGPAGQARLHRAEPARTRADVAQDHEGRRPPGPALAQVRTVRLLAHRVQAPAPARAPSEPLVPRALRGARA